MTDNNRIRVSEETWQWLNSQKEQGDDFDDVIRDLLGLEPGGN